MMPSPCRLVTLPQWRALRCNKKLKLGYFASLLAAALAGSSVQAQELDPVVLQLKWRHAFQFAGYYAALEKGYYEEVGLAVEIRELTGERTPVQMLLGGEVDYAVAGAELLIHRAKGDPLVALAAIFQHSPYAFLVREDAGITRVENFIGKRIMLGSDTQDAELQATLRRAGLRDGDYERQQTKYDAFSLLSGETDVLNAYVTDQGFTLQEAGLRTRYILPTRYGVDFYSDVLATTEREIERNPERVRNFRNATLRGWEYALANPNEIIELIMERYNTQDFSFARLEYEARISREMIQPLLVSLGYMNPQRWEHMRRIFAEEGFVDGESSIEGLIYSGIPEEGVRSDGVELDPDSLAIAAIVGTLLLAAGIQFHVWRVRRERQSSRDVQALLRAQHRRLRDALASLNSFSWEFDLAEQRFVYVSPGIRSMLGYVAGTWELLDDWLDAVAEEDREYARRFRAMELEAARDFVSEYRLQKVDGTKVWVMDVVRMVRDDSGRPVTLSGTVVDVSDLKRAEQPVPGMREPRRSGAGRMSQGA